MAGVTFGHCPWCGSPSPSNYPCCVPAWFFQIGVSESIREILSRPDRGIIRFGMDFRLPDYPEELQ